MLTVQCTWSRSRSPFELRFGHDPILVQINLQHNYALRNPTLSRYLLNSNSFICGATHREAVRTIFKVLSMTSWLCLD